MSYCPVGPIQISGSKATFHNSYLQSPSSQWVIFSVKGRCVLLFINTFKYETMIIIVTKLSFVKEFMEFSWILKVSLNDTAFLAAYFLFLIRSCQIFTKFLCRIKDLIRPGIFQLFPTAKAIKYTCGGKSVCLCPVNIVVTVPHHNH